jgi:signal transduction histidine kinase
MLEHATVRTGERSVVDLNRLVEEHVELVLQGTKGQRFEVHSAVETILDKSIPPVEVIPQELGRALLNILANAVHAIGEQHKKGIAGYVPSVVISTCVHGEHVEIRVQDNGTGIPAAIHERIFEPFFTTKPPGEGVGLGLSLTYNIITKRHAGTLEFESAENEGTTFVMTLPLQPVSAPMMAEEGERAARSRGGMGVG